MIDKETRKRIISLIHQEVVPAIGCTEPMSVALCTAKATEQLGCRPDHIEPLHMLLSHREFQEQE